MAENINISPDMINNLVNMLKNNGFGESSDNSGTNNSNSNNSSSDYSNSDNFSTSYSNLNSSDTNSSKTNSSDTNSSKTNSSDTNSSNTFNSIDFETIMKMKSIMETLNNSNDQDSKLLYSLKPYLRKSRQAKLDQYINILKITQVSKFFNASSENK